MVKFLLFVTGLILFLKGYYNVPIPSEFYLKHQQPLTEVRQAADTSPSFDRLTFVVIDALRYDFVQRMEKTMERVRNNQVMYMKTISRPPTVTLPRLKALLTGRNGGFVDSISNLLETNSDLLSESWLNYYMETGQPVLFAGDNTWLRLFNSSSFTEVTPVQSFFVKDTQEVDDTVTRSLYEWADSERYKEAVVILHYLGLDHVGHLGGISHPLFEPKLGQIDNLIEYLYATTHKKNSLRELVVVLGDHGMTDDGNHGGSSSSEKEAALLLFSSIKLSKTNEMISPPESAEQVDIVPTLSTLMGLPIPESSQGKLIPYVYDFFDLNKDRAMYSNRIQLCGTDQVSSIEKCQENRLSTGNDSGLWPMISGLILMFLYCFSASVLSSGSTIAITPYLVSFFSTAYVEEEHHIHFFVLPTYYIVDFTRRRKLESLLLAALVRLSRSWSLNGQQTHHTAALSQHIKNNPDLSFLLQCVTYFLFVLVSFYSFVVFAIRHKKKRQLALPLGIGFTAEFFHALIIFFVQNEILIPPFSSTVQQAQVAQILCLSCLAIKKCLGISLSPTLVSHLLLYTKPQNALMIFIFYLQSNLMTDEPDLIRSSLAYASFFALGGSNSLATVDLSQAYNAISTYNPFSVGLSTFFSNFSGPLVFMIHAHKNYAFVIHNALAVFVLCMACLHFRSHLFASTVFAPALLYKTFWLCISVLWRWKPF